MTRYILSDTAYGRLYARLNREPTTAEIKEEVARILEAIDADAWIERQNQKKAPRGWDCIEGGPVG